MLQAENKGAYQRRGSAARPFMQEQSNHVINDKHLIDRLVVLKRRGWGWKNTAVYDNDEDDNHGNAWSLSYLQRAA